MAYAPILQTEVRVIEKLIFAIFKKHYCRKCGDRLKLLKVTHYGIKKHSLEARGKYFRFDIFGHPVDYTFSIFECNECGNKIGIGDQYYIEKPHKKDKRKYDDYHQYLQSQDRKDGTNTYEEYMESIRLQKETTQDKQG